MHTYRLVFKEEPPSSVTFEAEDAAEAFRLAQSHDCPAELWTDDHHVCTLDRTGSQGEIWVITGSQRSSGTDRAEVDGLATRTG
jgi:hypothetical protein